MNWFGLQRQLSPSRWWRRLRHLHIENKGLKLMSLALAILLFFLSRQPISDVKLFNVPLEYRGLSPNVEISGDVEQTVSLRVRGPRDLVRALTPSQLSVVADLSSKEPGDRVVQLHTTDVSLPDNGIRVVQIEPASIRLLLEPKVRKRVPIEAQYMGQLADGLEVYHTFIEPPTVEIEGPQSQLNKIGYLLTETVNLSGRNKNFRATVDVETPHRSLRVLTPSPIRLSVEVGERRRFRRFANLPVHWLGPSASGRLPKTTVEVELYGPASAVETLEAKDIQVGVSADADTGTGLAQPKVILPPHIEGLVEVRSIIPKEVKLKK